MPELPEVETVRRGILPHAQNQTVQKVIIRCRKLRASVHNNLEKKLTGKTISGVARRGKYLIFYVDGGGAIIAHLGMSGVFYFSDSPPRKKHEHIGLQIGGRFLIYHDPRRFGSFVWTDNAPESVPPLCGLGPEPLSAKFNGGVLREKLKGKTAAIKTALLDGRNVAGVGNIYASESLHLAKIRPQTPAGKLSKLRADALATAIKTVLRNAIRAGGSTLRDFANPDNAPGYFQTKWKVYGRANEQCACGGRVKKIMQGARATYYCPRCQR